MPSLGMYTTEGTVTEWLRPPGSEVKAGEAVIQVTTEKAVYEIEAPEAGILHVAVAIGTVLPDQALIGHILAPGEAPPAAAAPAPPVAGAPSAPPSAPLQPAAPPTLARTPGAPVISSPAARRLAQERGIDIATITGTGPGGRIVEADVLAVASRGAAPAVPAAQPSAAQAGAPPGPPRKVRERIPLIGIRRSIADRLKASQTATASVTLTREVDVELFFEARERLKGGFAGGLPFDALFVKLVGSALAENGQLNAAIEGDAILLLDEVHVGFAVAVATGLLVPVVRDADSRSLTEIAADVLALSAKARAGQLRAEDMSGGTFTITNLGNHGVDGFSPIINPPQAAILGIGRILPRAVVREGQVVARRTCVLSLTFDHRVTDGVPAAKLLDGIATRMSDESGLNALG